jgi:uncharacterized protein (TIGR03083 family)
MDVERVWQATDAERSRLADLCEDLSDREWATPSLCGGWRVREVAAHLTQAHMGLRPATLGILRARGSFDRMIRDSAVRQAARPVEEYAPMLRAMVGSRRTAPFITPMEPLIDVLVHGQDITVPIGRPWPLPAPAASAAARRVWEMGFPFRARRRLAGLAVRATDADLALGEGPAVEGPIGAVLLLLTGRTAAALDRLSGDGATALRAAATGRQPLS